MSLGFYGCCQLEVEDEKLAIYSYRGENWNLLEHERAQFEGLRGIFIIDKQVLAEFAAHCEFQKKSAGKKKRIDRWDADPFNIDNLIEKKAVVVESLCGVERHAQETGYWRREFVVRPLLRHLLEEWRPGDQLPDTSAFIQ